MSRAIQGLPNSNAAEAVAFHIEGLLDAGEKIQLPQAIESHSAYPDSAGVIWAIASVDLASLSGKSKRLNISLAERVLRRIDAPAGKNGESRSGFIARAALQAV